MIKKRKVFRGSFVLAIILLFSQSCNDQEEMNADQGFQLSESHLAFLNTTQKALNGNFGNSTKSAGNLYGTLGPDEFMDRLAAAVTDEDFQFESINEEEYNAESSAFSEEYDFSTGDFSSRVFQHLEHFGHEMDHVLSLYENGEITEEEGISMIQSACANEGKLSYEDDALSQEEKEAMANVFYSYEQLTPGIANYIESYDNALELRGTANIDIDAPQSFLRRIRFGRILRGIARVVVAAAVTAVVVAVPVVAVAAIKGKLIGAALVKGGKVALAGAKWKSKKLSLKSPVMSGAGAGLKNAVKNWTKPWDWKKELQYGFKLGVL